MALEARFWLFLGAAGCGFLFPLEALLRGAVGCALSHIFNVNVLLDPKEDVSHLGDLMLHQVLVNGVGDLQPTNE